jgi:hypothetical protein
MRRALRRDAIPGLRVLIGGNLSRQRPNGELRLRIVGS